MKKIISLLLCLALMMGLGGCGTEKLDQNPGQTVPEQSESSAPTQGKPEPSETQNTEAEAEFNVADATGETQDFSKYEEVKKDKYHTDPIPEGQQKPVEPGEVEIDTSNQKSCYLTISCTKILDNMGRLADGKEVLVPSDGIILPRTKVVFYEGESVYDVLKRETRNRRVHMESNFTPMYNSAYIKGIGNLYEFDCGSESGWLYCVNGWYPNYGVSRYAIQQGDDLQFHYTCDLGRDLGISWVDQR